MKPALRLEQSSKIALDLAQLQYINGVIGLHGFAGRNK